jgi:tetratricopeptide (TPR) repeat protein
MNPTNWTPGLIVLAAGLLAGVAFVLFSRRAIRNEEPSGDLLADLEQRYQSLITQLKGLQVDQHRMDAPQFAAEKARLEQAAAAALKARDQFVKNGKHEALKVAARAAKLEQARASAPPGMLSPQLRGALIGAGAVLFFVFVGVMLSQESSPRNENASMTGKIPEGMPAGGEQPGSQEDGELTAAMARLNQAPDDVEAMALAAHLFINRDDYQHAASLTSRALGIDPFHLETRVHRSVLDAVQGKESTALAELLHLSDTFPDSSEALLYGGAVALRLGDKAQALSAWERFLSEAPADQRPPALTQQVEQLRRELQASAK